MKEEIFGFVYRMALQDAVRQRAYEGKKKDLYEIQEVKNTVKKYVDYMIKNSGLTEEEHEKFFKDSTWEVCKIIDKEEFTFGNAQKLINMTTKYLYIVCYADSTLR